MPLQSSDLPAYAAYIAARDGSNAGEALGRLQRDVADGTLSLSDVFVTFDLAGERISGSVRIYVFGQDFLVLTEWRGDEGAGTHEMLSGLLSEADARASELRAKEMSTRVSLEGMTDDYRRALGDAGFEFQGRRVEYKTPVSELPSERPSRLVWRTMADVGEQPSSI